MNNQVEITVSQLEKEDMKTFLQLNPHLSRYTSSLHFDICYLYHGIRFHDQMKTLENILKNGILAGKHIKDYNNYSDNCNNGEYVSLLDKTSDNNLEYETFIEPNISLLVSPLCGAYKTIYVSYELWENINLHYPNLKNRYSYAFNEYQIKDRVPIELIEAIGLPYQLLVNNKNKDQAEMYKRQIIDMLNCYGIGIPIVDTSNSNQLIYKPIKKKEKSMLLN